jgi:hypothetical protein
MKSSLSVALATACVLTLGFAASAEADPWGHWHGYYDVRYGHNHYYPPRGYFVGGLPPGNIVVTHYSEHFYYAGGVWYAPRGPRFVVVAPPVGVFVPVLPTYYTTVWFGGIPYYYANDTYYVYHDDMRQYEVVAPPEGQPGPAPAGASQGAPQATPGGDQVFIYPKNGQTEEQQAQDKYECHRWASTQTGFDPTQTGGGVPPDQNGAKRGEYHRALGACLEGRGYSVK